MKKAEIDAALEEQMSQLNHYLETKPAPTKENIDILKQDRAQVDHLYQQLLANVSQRPGFMHHQIYDLLPSCK